MADDLNAEGRIADTHGEPGQAASPAQAVEVAGGPGQPASAHLVEDRYIGVRASHLQPAPRPLGPEITPPVDARTPDPAAQNQDAGVIPEEPSVWEATGDDAEDR
jgi:hypothetical protein